MLFRIYIWKKSKKEKERDGMMAKIQMQTPIVEMDGDEMTRILWKMIKDHLLLPFIDLNTGVLRSWAGTP